MMRSQYDIAIPAGTRAPQGCRVRLLAAAVLASAMLAGCTIGPQTTAPQASYDLGPPRAHANESPLIRASLALPSVAPPAWLDNQGIIYRLNYQDAARPQAYANSRWSAPPARLLTYRMRSRFAASSAGIVSGDDGTRADYVLRVELEDFSQSFDAVNQSRVSVRARATIVNLADRTLLAQRTFAVERAAAPDAAGAVKALGEAGDALIEDLLAWTAQRLKAGRP